MIFQKPLRPLGTIKDDVVSPNLMEKCFNMNLEAYLFWSQKVKGQGFEAHKTVPVCTLVSAVFF